MTEPQLRLTPWTISLAIVTILSILSTAPQVTPQIQQIASLLTTIGAALLTIVFVTAQVRAAFAARIFFKSNKTAAK